MLASIRNLAASCLLILAATLPAAAQTTEKLKVVATFSILGDFVRQIGGDRVEVVTLVGPDGDAHVYSPTPADGRRLAEAKIVLTHGLTFEGWINRLIKSSGTKAIVAVTSNGVTALAETGDHGHGAVDPHAWQDVRNARIYVVNIRDALSAADPQGKVIYEANAAAYGRQLDALEAEIKDAVARIPADRRRIITSHDAFAYFERAYGIDFIAPQGVSTESEASAKDVAQIIRQIRREKVPAVFFENISDPRLIERIAKETGSHVGGRLYSDALSGPAGPAGTYIDMMRHNIRAFSTALSS